MNSKKLLIAMGVVSVVLYAVFMLTRESPNEKYEEFRAERSPDRPDFSADNAYLLHIDFSSGALVDSQSAIRDALLEELRESLKPIGLNPDYGRKAGGGKLGTITASVVLECQSYQGENATSTLSIPKSIDLILTVQSARGSSSWDGKMNAFASTVPPTRVSDANFYSVQKKYVSNLVKTLVSQFNEQKRFERY